LLGTSPPAEDLEPGRKPVIAPPISICYVMSVALNGRVKVSAT
jgi:hypothetical protein